MKIQRDTTDPAVRYPRTLFAHAHIDGTATFPPTTASVIDEMITELPDNWNGTDKIIIKYLPGEGWTDVPFNIVLNAGQDTEAFNIHTQTLALHTITGAANVYLYEDITALVAAFIALIAPNDTIWITSEDTWGVAGLCIGLEIDET